MPGKLHTAPPAPRLPHIGIRCLAGSCACKQRSTAHLPSTHTHPHPPEDALHLEDLVSCLLKRPQCTQHGQPSSNCCLRSVDMGGTQAHSTSWTLRTACLICPSVRAAMQGMRRDCDILRRHCKGTAHIYESQLHRIEPSRKSLPDVCHENVLPTVPCME
jgi:hypothetical protein